MLHARFVVAVNSLAPRCRAPPHRSATQLSHPQCIHKVVGQHALACKSLLCCLKYLCRRKQDAAAKPRHARPGQDEDSSGSNGAGEEHSALRLGVYFVWLRFS